MNFLARYDMQSPSSFLIVYCTHHNRKTVTLNYIFETFSSLVIEITSYRLSCFN